MNQGCDEQFPERYVINRLSESERAAFEEHLVDCGECQEAIRAAGALRRALMAVRRDFNLPIWRRPMAIWQAGALAAAGMVLALIPAAMSHRELSAVQTGSAKQRELVAALQTQLDHAPRPQGALPIYPLEQVRGGEAAALVPLPVHNAGVIVMIPRDVAAQASAAVLYDRSNRPVWSTANLPHSDSDGVGLTIPAGVFSPGGYTLILRSIGGPAARFPFEVIAAQ